MINYSLIFVTINKVLTHILPGTTDTKHYLRANRPHNLKLTVKNSFISARCNIYISRLCHDASPFVCLSVCRWRLCTVVTGCDGSRISLHSWIDGCLYYLLTTPDPDRRMGWCRDFWWKEGMEKVVIVAISLILLILLSMDRNHVTYLFISETELLNIKTFNILSQFIWTISKFFYSNFGRKCIMN